MIKDYEVYDNILPDPDFYVELSKLIGFYSNDSQKIDGINLLKKNENRPKGAWRGLRSDYLHLINRSYFDEIFDCVLERLFGDTKNMCYRYIVESYLHFTPGYIKEPNKWWHNDDCSIISGVIYLNKNPEVNSGTMVDINGNIVNVENVFNRLVVYKGNLLHRPSNCYGTSINNTRLTITFFVHNLEFYVN